MCCQGNFSPSLAIVATLVQAGHYVALLLLLKGLLCILDNYLQSLCAPWRLACQNHVFELLESTHVHSKHAVVGADNAVEDCGCYMSVNGLSYPWVPAGALMYAQNVASVKFANNYFSNAAGCMYGNYLQPIQVGPASLDVSIQGVLS